MEHNIINEFNTFFIKEFVKSELIIPRLPSTMLKPAVVFELQSENRKRSWFHGENWICGL